MRAIHKLNRFNGLCRMFGALASLLALSGCPDTELKACYQSDECGAGQVCTVDGRCAMPGGGGDLGLDAGLDAGPDLGPDGGRLDGGRLDGLLPDQRTSDGPLPDVATGEMGALDLGQDAGLPTVSCRVVAGQPNPDLRLSPDPYGYVVVTTGANQAVRIIARQPTGPDSESSSGDGRVVAHCTQIDRLDVVQGAKQLDLGAISGFSGGRRAVVAMVAGDMLHAAWWDDEPLVDDMGDLLRRRVVGVSLALDIDGCPVDDARRRDWSQFAHRYAGDFDLAWLRNRLYVAVDLPLDTIAPRLRLVSVDQGEPEVDYAALQYGANFVSAVSARDGETLDVFATVTPTGDPLLVHSRIGFDEVGIYRLDQGEDDSTGSALDVSRLIGAVAADDGRFGVLAQEVPGPDEPQPGCEIQGTDLGVIEETNGTPQQLVFQIVEPERPSEPEVVFQVYGTPMTATGDPLYAGLAWQAALQRYAIAFSTQHGSANSPDDNGIRLALLDTEANVTHHLEMARYPATCQTVTHRPLVNATAEGFLVTWLHEYSHLRHTRVLCHRTDQD